MNIRKNSSHGKFQISNFTETSYSLNDKKFFTFFRHLDENFKRMGLPHELSLD